MSKYVILVMDAVGVADNVAYNLSYLLIVVLS